MQIRSYLHAIDWLDFIMVANIFWQFTVINTIILPDQFHEHLFVCKLFTARCKQHKNALRVQNKD